MIPNLRIGTVSVTDKLIDDGSSNLTLSDNIGEGLTPVAGLHGPKGF